MSVSPFSAVDSINVTPQLQSVLKKNHLVLAQIEEVFLNFPSVKQIDIAFTDGQQRYYVEGMTDMGMTIGMVVYTNKKKLSITYLKIIS